MELKDIIASNIRFYRTIMLEMSQEELSEAIGYSQQTISRIETATTGASIKFLVAFANYADVSLDCLCGVDRTMVLLDKSLEKHSREDGHGRLVDFNM